MKPESGIGKQGPGPRKAYTPPALVSYGLVRDLTQTGTGDMTENNCISGMATRQRCSSERHIKENIVRIGDHPLGIGLYLFDYLPEYRDRFGHGRQFGVMIDEVEKVMPEAVSLHPDGCKRVDHSLLGIYRHRH
ncbi:MAG: tail fiber domain-containing protein [Dechloromonas sp.]|nr:MAG: tail fiber domain-containing protein [Dechloromonas sp.]